MQLRDLWPSLSGLDEDDRWRGRAVFALASICALLFLSVSVANTPAPAIRVISLGAFVALGWAAGLAWRGRVDAASVLCVCVGWMAATGAISVEGPNSPRVGIFVGTIIVAGLLYRPWAALLVTVASAGALLAMAHVDQSGSVVFSPSGEPNWRPFLRQMLAIGGFVFVLTRSLRRGNERLKEQKAELAEQNEALTLSERRYSELNAKLEERVQQRTAQLRDAQSALEQENVIVTEVARRYRTVLDKFQLGLFTLDRAGGCLSCDGPLLAEFGLDEPALLGRSIERLPVGGVDVLAVFRRALQGNLERGLALVGPRFFEYSVSPVHHKDGGIVGVMGLVHDVTERRQREQKLEDQRLFAAHQTGVAEIASEVLHAVGNAMTSAKTSCSIGLELLDQSSVKRLARVNEMFEAQNVSIDSFLADDPRAKLAFQYYLAVGQSLKVEHGALRERLGEMEQDLAKVARAVAAQGEHSQMARLREAVDLDRLVESAIALAGSAGDAEVRLITHPLPVGPVVGNRPQLTNAVLRLLRNAREACEGCESAEIRVEVALGEGDSRLVKVIHTGLGFAETERAGLFSEPSPRGERLHRAANTAAQFGGRVECHSEGPNRGATFTLVLPAPNEGQSAPPDECTPVLA